MCGSGEGEVVGGPATFVRICWMASLACGVVDGGGRVSECVCVKTEIGLVMRGGPLEGGGAGNSFFVNIERTYVG
jgi:hypothetical protein